MALGKPAISTLRGDLSLRQVQILADQVRERLIAIEQALGTTTAQAGQNTLQQTQANLAISQLRQQLAQLQAQIDALTGDVFEDFATDEAITANSAVYPSSSEGVSLADPTNPLAVFAVLGLATNSAGAGGRVRVRKRGPMQIDDAGFDVGRAVYVGTGGTLTQAPSYASVAIPVGVAIAADYVYVLPDFPALYVEGFDPGFDEFMPITYGLAQQIAGDASQLVLYDVEGRAILTADGRDILVEA